MILMRGTPVLQSLVLGVCCARNSGDMRDSLRIEVLRFCLAALVRIFSRTFSFLCCWRCRNGRRLRSCLARSGVLQARSTEFLANFSPSLHVSALCLELVSLSLWCTLPSREKMFIGFRGLPKPYSTGKSRTCSTLPGSVSNLSTRGTRNSAASANFTTFPYHGFAKPSSKAVFLLPST